MESNIDINVSSRTTKDENNVRMKRSAGTKSPGNIWGKLVANQFLSG
jgi:hypothetical protein